MATATKKGKITYTKKTPPSSLSEKQINMADKIAKEIAKIGQNAQITYDSGTIDVTVIMNKEIESNGLNIGRFRVFWDRYSDNKIKYLGVGIGYFDGYEIKRGWSDDIEISDVSRILKKDMEYYNSKKK